MTRIFFLSWFILSVFAAMQSGETHPMPPNVAERIGRAQIFVNHINDRAILIGRRDVVWGDSGEPIPGIFSMRYLPSDRDSDKGRSLVWYTQVHPEQVVRKCNEQPAFEFDDPNVPIDIRNPEVRREVLSGPITTDLSQGAQAIALDNVEAINLWSRCGVLQNGTFHRLYTGEKVDSVFTNDVADWLGWLAARLHEQGVLLAGNHYYHGLDRLGYLRVASKLDMVVDEAGYVRDCKPEFVGDDWLDRISLFRGITKSKPLVIINYLCRDAASVTPEAIDWSLATYLLIKGDYTYLALSPQKEIGEFVDYPDLYLRIGHASGEFSKRDGVYFREFDHALALVNPSRSMPAIFRLDKDMRWADHRNLDASLTDHVALPPESAFVLVTP
jgi:hypothetical protein